MASVRQAMFDSADQDNSGTLDKYETAKVIKDYYRPMHGHPSRTGQSCQMEEE